MKYNLCLTIFYPKFSKVNTNKRFVNIDIGSMGGTHCTCCYIKDNRSYYFDSLGGPSVNFILQQVQ